MVHVSDWWASANPHLVAAVAVMTLIGFLWRGIIHPINKYMDEIQLMKTALAEIHAQVHLNSGTSLKDVVARMESRQVDILGDVTQIDQKLDSHIDFHLKGGEK